MVIVYTVNTVKSISFTNFYRISEWRSFLFSSLLKELRSKNRITQSELAKNIGVSTGNVSDWESGRSKPGYTALSELSRFFEVCADYLL